MATLVEEVELTNSFNIETDCSGYGEALLLLRCNGRPIGSLRVRIRDGRLPREEIDKSIGDSGLEKALEREQVRRWLLKNVAVTGRLPACSVVIPTRNRSTILGRCLQSLVDMHSKPAEIIVVDNAPSDDSTFMLAQQFPVKYVREDRPGLNWARSRGAHEAKGEIITFIDDDIVVDRRWLSAMLRSFDGCDVAAVTGLVMPAELETDAQEFFEMHGGHRRGFKRRVFDSHIITPSESGTVGVGGNMAIRRDLVLSLKLFDCEMDCGTVTRSGGDTYAFYKLLAGGYSIVYEPEALVWHYHRTDLVSLRETLKGYGVGVYAALTRELIEHKEWPAITTGISWFCKYSLWRLIRSLFRRPGSLPIRLVVAQIAGIFLAPFAYFSSRKKEREYAKREVVKKTPEAAHVS